MSMASSLPLAPPWIRRRIATGVFFTGQGYTAQWSDPETGAFCCASGFDSAADAIAHRESVVGPGDRRSQNGGGPGGVERFRRNPLPSHSLEGALQEAHCNAEGWAWAWGRTATGHRLVACREPDGQISVSLEIWRRDRRYGHAPDEMVTLRLDAPVVRAAWWQPDVLEVAP